MTRRAKQPAKRQAQQMHQTTLRFGADLWEAISSEAAATGVSAAHYVRDAALMRVASDASRRGVPEHDGFG